MRGLILKTFEETWLPTLLFGAALFAVKFLLTSILPQFEDLLGDALQQMPFIETLISGLLGTEVGQGFTAQAIQSFLWVHPVVLSLVWAHEIIFCTRLPAGEVDRGTIDVLLGLPVSRRMVYFCESIMWLATGLIVLALGALGHMLAAPNMPEAMRPELSHALIVELNFLCIYVAVGGMSFLVSACCNRRGRAIAIVFGILLASFLLNFVAQFWDPARQFAFLGIMNYYQPAEALQSGSLPLADITVLLVVGGVTWLAGCEVLARRDICTL